jgi:LacI family transcriptional regulator
MVTMRDVAKLAGVSLPVVSYVINGGPRPVAPGTRDRVLRVIEELGYKPNRLARGLARKGTLSIALIIPNISDLFFAHLAQAIEEAAYAAGFSLLLCNTGQDRVREIAYFGLLAEKRIDGILLVTSGLDSGQLQNASGEDLPLVVLDREIEGAFVDTVIFDNFTAGKQAAEHLLRHGGRSIACIAGPKTLSGAVQRVEGYKEALKQAGIAPVDNLIKWCDYTFGGGMGAASGLLKGKIRTESILACNDEMGAGAIHAARQAGIDVPRQLAVAGIGDSLIGQMVIPQLTTVNASVDDMGRTGMEMLLERIGGTAPRAQRRVVLDTRLVIRGSCGCARPG